MHTYTNTYIYSYIHILIHTGDGGECVELLLRHGSQTYTYIYSYIHVPMHTYTQGCKNASIICPH